MVGWSFQEEGDTVNSYADECEWATQDKGMNAFKITISAGHGGTHL